MLAEIQYRKSQDYAKGAAKEAGIDLFTYAEKVAQLMDLRYYLQSLIDRFEKSDPDRPTEPPLADYYIDLRAERWIGKTTKQIPIIDTYIQQWLQDKNTRHHLTIFGAFGSGKSSLCQKIAHDLAAAYLKDQKSTRIPILLNLREFIGKVKIDAFITSFLDQEYGVPNPKYALFRTMHDLGLFLVIFDGFDEMAVKADADALESNLAEIDKIASRPNSKVLLTSRPEHFIDEAEERRALSPSMNGLGNRLAEYEPLRILPWDKSQIERFLEKCVALIKEMRQPWTFYRDRIKSIPTLSDLFQRPVLLDMIVKTLPRIIKDYIVVNLPNSYQVYLSGEITPGSLIFRVVCENRDRASYRCLQGSPGA
jgi:hypothetical protein